MLVERSTESLEMFKIAAIIRYPDILAQNSQIVAVFQTYSLSCGKLFAGFANYTSTGEQLEYLANNWGIKGTGPG